MTIQKRILTYAIPLVIILAASSYFLVSRFISEDKTVAAVDLAIQKAERQLTVQTDRPDSYSGLAYLYLQKVRETADISYYQKILDLMDRAEKIDSENPEFTTIRAAVFAGRHDFKNALIFAQKSVERAPETARYYGILADAQIELGQYDQAVATLQKMVNLRPDFASYSRISHLRELHGDISGAEQAMLSALQAGGAFQENEAWARVELGKLYFTHDKVAAQREFEHAIYVLPDYARALQWLGRMAFFKNDFGHAEEYLKKAFDILPIAEHATDLGDFYTVSGDKARAMQYYTLVQASYADFERKGTKVDSEFAIFLLDRDLDNILGLKKAEQAWQDRPSLYSADVLAWAYYKNGRYAEAARYSDIALKLKTRDPVLYYHAGLIAEALKKPQQAKQYFRLATQYNPDFSILLSAHLKELTK